VEIGLRDGLADTTLRVVIGEDQALMREGLMLVLERAGFEVVAVAADADDLVRKAHAHAPDIVVADIRMPPTQSDEGLRAALAIRAARPETAILVLSQHVQRTYASELLETGAAGGGVGYLLKQRVTDSRTFCSDVRRVSAGASILDPEVVATMLARTRRDDPIDRLTPRQREVLGLMAEGRSNAGIAERLYLSEKAVLKHVAHIYDSLGLRQTPDDHRRVLAVVRYLQR
jgi:DNA-binding NarL/FixJ family response regulator